MDIKIIEADYNKIRPLVSKGRKESVAFNNDKGATKYLAAYFEDMLIGCVGYMEIRGGEVRYKSDFVIKPFRREGVYTKLFSKRDDLFKTKKRFSAFCTSNSINMYIKEGFKIIRRYENGITYVKKSTT